MWFRLSQLILRNRAIVIAVLAVLTSIFGYFALTHLQTDNKYGNMLPKDSPAQSEYLKLKEMFGEDGGSLVIAIQTDSLYTEENFLKWKQLGQRISEEDGVISVLSEADLVSIKNNTEEQKFEIEPIFKDDTYQEKSIDSIRKEIRQIPLYHGLLYNDSTHVTLMLINIQEEYLSDQKKMGVVVDVESIAKEYEKDFGQIRFSGLPHIRIVMGKRVVNEMFLFIGLALFVTSVILYLLFRSLKVVLYCDLVVFTAVIWALGSIAIMGFKLSILMALIPPLMIVIGIPNCVYLLNKYHHEFLMHGNKMKALTRVISKVGYATFLTNLTTAIGFFTFSFTNSDKLVEFGVSATVNIMFVFILAITIIPIVFSYAKEPKPRHLKHLEQRLAKSLAANLSRITMNYRKQIYWIAGAVIVLAIIGATRMEATGNLTSDLPESDQILKDVKFLEKNFNGVVPFEILIDYKKEGKMFDRSLLTKMETIQAEMKKDTLFSRSMSIVDFMKIINMAYYGNNREMYKLIKRSDMARLSVYLDNFEKDMAAKNRMNTFKDSIIEGNNSYIDSIVYQYPDIAMKLWETENANENRAVDLDSLSEEKVTTLDEKAIQNLLSRPEIDKEVQRAISELYPNTATVGLSLNGLVDTANTTYRIRMQMTDLGSYETNESIEKVSNMLDTVLNPKHEQAMSYYSLFKRGKKEYIDSIFALSNSYLNNTTYHLVDGDEEKIFEFDLDPDLLRTYFDKPEFAEALKAGIEDEKLEYLVTGTAVVVAEGTHYLVVNLFTSILFAIVIISLLMATLFFDVKMVFISLIPNLVPLIVTAGIMGFFSIPIKPSTLLVFSIALGISVDDTIHFLAKYKQELNERGYDQQTCILNALYDTGISMFYTALVLICGFSMFGFSQFGGTKALGLLISFTLLVATSTNLFILPSLLLGIQKRIAFKAYDDEPLLRIYNAEVDINIDELEVKSAIENTPEIEENTHEEEE